MRITAILTAAVIAANITHFVSADAPEDIFPEVSAESICVIECETGTVIYERNADDPRPMGHFTKLMTVLASDDAVKTGRIGHDTSVKVSANANSQQGTQIWLERGETVPVSDLLKAIIIGNANDACIALAETVSESVDDHISTMNSISSGLGMKSTHFADVCGFSAESCTTAHDISVMCAELVRRGCFEDMFTTWMDTVRDGRTELVNNNRLVRYYKGILGIKACASEQTGECIAAAAKRGDMEVCVVLLGCRSNQDKFSEAEKMLDAAFSHFRKFTPETDKKLLRPVTVRGGVAPKVGVRSSGVDPVIVKAEKLSEISSTFEIAESLSAPVAKGDTVGKVEYQLDGKTVMTTGIIAEKSVEKMTFSFAVKRCILNLLAMHK